MGDFEPIDWSAPVDVAAHLEAAPVDATMKGFLTAAVVRRVRAAGVQIGRDRYIDFRAYPLREHLQVLAEGAPILYPGVPLRTALRRLARLTLPAVGETTVGKVMLSLAEGSRGMTALSLATKTYRFTRSVGSARVAEVGGGVALIELRDIHDYADSLHAGIFESLLATFGHGGRVDVRRHSPFDIDLRLHLDGAGTAG